MTQSMIKILVLIWAFTIFPCLQGQFQKKVGKHENQIPSFSIAAQIDDQLNLKGNLDFSLNTPFNNTIGIYVFSAGKDSLGSPLLKINTVKINEQDIEYTTKEGWIILGNLRETEKLHISFELDLKRIEDWRSTFGYSIFPSHNKATCWYPDIYLDNSRKYFKDFTVDLSYPSDVVIQTSGLLNNQLKTNTNFNSKFTAQNIEHFGLNVAKDFVQKTVTLAGGVQLSYFCAAALEDTYQKISEIAAEIVKWYSSKYGFFPKKHIGIAMGHERWKGGFPTENLFYIHRGNLKPEFLKWITAHELGHYYWGYHVQSASSRFLSGLMLAHGIWIDQLYISEETNDALEEVWHNTNSASGMIERYLTATLMNVDQRMKITKEEQNKQHFDSNMLIFHGKAATGMYLLSRQMGYHNFLKVQKELLNDFASKPLTEDDFLERCSGYWSQSDKFYREWMRGDAIIEYTIEGIKTVEKNNSWHYSFDVVKKGTVDYPVEIAVVDALGEVNMHKSTSLSKETITGSLTSEPKSFTLDPFGAVPMWNSSHPSIQALFIKALYRAGHTRVAKELAKSYLQDHEDEAIAVILKR